MSTEWLAKLIAFDTTSRNSNLPLIEAVKEWLDLHGVPYHLSFDETGKKANLFATLGDGDGGLILSGHTDVVPVDGQQWTTDPFKAIEKEGRIYGRGACDMKGFLAVVLSLIPAFKMRKLKKPLHLAFTYDEEVGCLGAKVLLKDLGGYRPAACVVGEPTLMRPVVAHKGIQVLRCRVHGRAAHSSLTPQGSNAIEFAALLIARLREKSEALKEGPLDPHFNVPFTTISTNMISGGIAGNVIPELCEFLFEFRHLPEVDPRALIDEIKSYMRPKMELIELSSVPSFEAFEEAPITKLSRSILNETAIQKVSYATEAGLFQRQGIPTLICGPGSIEQAHRPDEYVALSELKKCEDFLLQLVDLMLC